ncbi:hypothetical protein DFP72DRAFT_847717 [Ephemerocybe angulata]|uniref:Uncharacterized protein n=1 Tax=Ephemerocybe angulata TaxID=980116 RepID=A0A8H6M8K8_9AGAR|nr:hypothetical protein DFP72DRAFT_847717 [Tulosesus angulatus]
MSPTSLGGRRYIVYSTFRPISRSQPSSLSHCEQTLSHGRQHVLPGEPMAYLSHPSSALPPSSSAPTHTLHTPIPRRRRSPDAILLRLGVWAPRSRYAGQPAPSLNSKSKSEFVSSSEMPLAGRISVAFGQFRRQHTRFPYALLFSADAIVLRLCHSIPTTMSIKTIITDTSSISLRADLKPSTSQSPTDPRFRVHSISPSYSSLTQAATISAIQKGDAGPTNPIGNLARWPARGIHFCRHSDRQHVLHTRRTSAFAGIRSVVISQPRDKTYRMYTWDETWASETPYVNGTPLLSDPLAGFISVVFSTSHHWIVGSLERLTLPKPHRSTGDGARDISAETDSRAFKVTEHFRMYQNYERSRNAVEANAIISAALSSDFDTSPYSACCLFMNTKRRLSLTNYGREKDIEVSPK